jgi:hypothetical protein
VELVTEPAMGRVGEEAVSGKTTRPCPGCGRTVVLDDVALTVRHEGELCDLFVQQMKRFGLVAKRESWAEMVRRDGSVVEKGKA